MTKKYSSDKEMQKLFEGFRSSMNESFMDTLKGAAAAVGLGGKEKAPEAPAEPAAPQEKREMRVDDLLYDKKFLGGLQKVIGRVLGRGATPALILSIPKFGMDTMEKAGNTTYHIDAVVRLQLGSMVSEDRIRQRIGQMEGDLSVGALAGLVAADKRIRPMAEDLAYKIRQQVYNAARETILFYQESNNVIVKDRHELSSQSMKMLEMEARNIYKKLIGSKIKMMVGEVALPPRKIGWARHNVDTQQFKSYLEDGVAARVPFSIKSLYLASYDG